MKKKPEPPFLEKLSKAVKDFNREYLTSLLAKIPSDFDKTASENKKIFDQAAELLEKLRRDKETITNILNSYIVNQKLWGILKDASYTAGKGKKIIYILDYYIDIYISKQNKLDDDNNPILKYIKETCICQLFYFFLKQNIVRFKDIYPEINRRTSKNLEKYGCNEWQKLDKEKGTNKHEFTLTEEGTKIYKAKPSGDFFLRQSATDKPTKLISDQDLITEIYCYYYKFWFQEIDIPCQPNTSNKATDNSNFVYGYIGQEALKSLSQHLPQDETPNHYPIRTYCSDKTDKSVNTQAIDCIEYLIDDTLAKEGLDTIITKPLEEFIEIVNKDKPDINIILIDATLPCGTASDIFRKEEIHRYKEMEEGEKNTSTHTIFLYVYRTVEGVRFIEPIVFIELDDQIVEARNPPIRMLENSNKIVENYKKDKPDCVKLSSDKPASSTIPSDTPGDAEPEGKGMNKKPTRYEEEDKSDEDEDKDEDKDEDEELGEDKDEDEELGEDKDFIYFNLNDIGCNLPILEIGLNKKIQMLLGNEYILNEIAYRNLYEISYPYNLTGRLSGNVLAGKANISLINKYSREIAKSTVKSPKHLGGTSSIYNCLTKQSIINKTPFYRILEDSEISKSI